MAAIKRFEELESWKLARKLVQRVYQETAAGPLSTDFALRDQMRRSCISIMSNLAEGFERNGNREFIQFCHVAKASSGEFRSQLYIALDAGHISQVVFDELSALVIEISRSISGMIKYLSMSEYKGSKFQEDPLPYISVPAAEDFEL